MEKANGHTHTTREETDILCHVVGREELVADRTGEAEEVPVAVQRYQRLRTPDGLTTASTLWGKNKHL